MKLATLAAAGVAAVTILTAAPRAAAAAPIPVIDNSASVFEIVAPLLTSAAVMLALTHRPRRSSVAPARADEDRSGARAV